MINIKYSNNKIHKIILEGCDGTGKSTLAEKIKAENPDIDFRIIHCTRHTPNNFGYFIDILRSDENIIMDRSFIGQFIYNTAADRNSNGWLKNQELINLEDYINALNANSLSGYYIHTIYVDAPDSTILYNCKKDSDDSYYDLNYIRDIKSRYKYFMRNTSLDIQYYFNEDILVPKNNSNTDILSDEELDNLTLNFDYSKLPTIYAVDFDGTIARNAFPKITENTEVNLDLIERLKIAKDSGIKLILWTNRTGSALTDACNFCADLGLAFDAVNDNVKEVRENLCGGPRKVYADFYIDDKAIDVHEWKATKLDQVTEKPYQEVMLEMQLAGRQQLLLQKYMHN